MLPWDIDLRKREFPSIIQRINNPYLIPFTTREAHTHVWTPNEWKEQWIPQTINLYERWFLRLGRSWGWGLGEEFVGMKTDASESSKFAWKNGDKMFALQKLQKTRGFHRFFCADNG